MCENVKSIFKVIAIKPENAIVVNNQMMKDSKEYRTILLHEREHFESNLFYKIGTGISAIKRKETIVNRKVIKKELPFEKLLSLMKKYETVCEIAEEVCLSVELINYAFSLYKDQGLFEKGDTIQK